MAAADVECRKVRAISARTEYVDGYGMVHFNPDSPKEGTRFPLMPVSVIDRMVADGWIADDVEAAAPAAVPADDIAPETPVDAPVEATAPAKPSRKAKADAGSEEIPPA